MYVKTALNSVTWSMLIAITVRLGFMAYGIWQDATMVVKYTDVDYFVFTDAAKHVSQGKSPYDRATYRYTPMLAWMLLPNVYITTMFGKLLFILCDVLAGWIIYVMTRRVTDSWTALRSAQSWLFNPLPITVSSRGNAESVMAVLVLASLYFMQSRKTASLAMGFILFAVSVHFKIYPVTYALPYYLALSGRFTGHRCYLKLCGCDVWPNATRVVMVVLSLIVFTGLTGICYLYYGWEFIQETYLHHVIRRDTRHNFSVYFYMFYLIGGESWGSSFIAILAFLPQLILLLMVSFKYSNDLPFCCFLNTFIFVTFNKVVTSQYFLWYLCLLPLVLPKMRMRHKEAGLLISSWFISQALWLAPAYYLEFEGKNTFIYIWIAGIVFFLDNLFIMYRIIVAHSKYHKVKETKPLRRMSLNDMRRKYR